MPNEKDTVSPSSDNVQPRPSTFTMPRATITRNKNGKEATMGFIDAHPNYKNYDETRHIMKTLPSGLLSALEGFIPKYADDSTKLKSVCHTIATLIPCALTQEYKWSYLLGELSSLLHKLSQKRFDKFMDFLADFVYEHAGQPGIEELNDLFDEYGLGFHLQHEGRDAIWMIREEMPVTEVLEKAQSETKDVCDQSLDHLKQAHEHLKNAKKERARKDAVRDAVSAMEALLKALSGKDDIDKAVTELLNQNKWGTKTILRDGQSTWHRIHEEYPDVRHGTGTPSTMTESEAIYWVNRISAYIVYLCRRKRENG